MGGYQGHHEAVGFAGIKVQELEDATLRVKTDLAPEVISHIIVAVGESPVSDDARMALELSQVLLDKFDQISSLCEEIKGRLNAYSAGWM